MKLRKNEYFPFIELGDLRIKVFEFRIFAFRYFILLSVLVSVNCAGALTEKGGQTRNNHITPQATLIRSSNYKILGTSSGESSTLFLFGLFPVTNTLDIEYAMSQAVQKVPGGQSLVGIQYWHETHVFFPLGTVSVLVVEGKVISYESDISEQDKTQKKNSKKQ
jgi:hypothetical protein